MLVKPAPLPTNTPDTDVMLPVADTLTNVPTLVMFGCAELVTLPANAAKLALATVLTLAPLMLVKPAPLPLKTPDTDVTLPVTDKLTNVPTLVIFG